MFEMSPDTLAIIVSLVVVFLLSLPHLENIKEWLLNSFKQGFWR